MASLRAVLWAVLWELLLSIKQIHQIKQRRSLNSVGYVCWLVEKLERESPMHRCDIYIATKDVGFMRAKSLVERNEAQTIYPCN